MTHKLKLDLEVLEVTSFDTDGTAGGRGTVMGAADSIKPGCADDSYLTGACCPDNSFLTGACCEHTWGVTCAPTSCEDCA